MKLDRITTVLAAVAVLGLATSAAACDKKKDAKPAAEKAEGDKGEAKKDEAKADEPKADEAKADEPKADEAKADEPKADEAKADEAKADEPKADEPKADEAKADYIKFSVDHHDPTKGMVDGHFETFEVKEAVVDLDDPANAKAVVEIDLGSISTGIAKRDNHVKSPDFFDVVKFPKATITVAEVAKDGDAFKAVATVSLHGVEKKLPVTFKVVEDRDDAIVIEGTHESFKRMDFGVGGKPEDTNVAADQKVMLRLTLPKKKG